MFAQVQSANEIIAEKTFSNQKMNLLSLKIDSEPKRRSHHLLKFESISAFLYGVVIIILRIKQNPQTSYKIT